ncbi:unnamed protein product, partial [Sphacelaria rigidula]
ISLLLRSIPPPIALYFTLHAFCKAGLILQTPCHGNERGATLAIRDGCVGTESNKDVELTWICVRPEQLPRCYAATAFSLPSSRIVWHSILVPFVDEVYACVPFGA